MTPEEVKDAFHKNSERLIILSIVESIEQIEKSLTELKEKSYNNANGKRGR